MSAGLGPDAWPQAVKDFVNDCLKKANETKRQSEVEAELRDLISNAWANNAISSTDWSKVKLQALQAPSAVGSTYSFLLGKRKGEPYAAQEPQKRPSSGSQSQASQGPYTSSLERIRSERQFKKASSSSSASKGYEGHAQKRGEPKLDRDGTRDANISVRATLGLPHATEYSSSIHRPAGSSESGTSLARTAHPSVLNGVSRQHEMAATSEASFGTEKLAHFDAMNLHGPPKKPMQFQNISSSTVNGYPIPQLVASRPSRVSTQKAIKGTRALYRGTQGVSIASEISVNDSELGHRVVGTSKTLEKRYLRLTSAPDPSTVRPLAVMKETMELLKKKWRAQEVTYEWMCDQMKSLRQDLTVQRIQNEFTVHVYVIHARIALEKEDIGEFNQCQGQLRNLFGKGIKGPVAEFTAYRILYLLLTRNRSALNALISELEPADHQEDAIKHALDVRAAVASGNYHEFFKLFLQGPNMNGYLMDQFVDRERTLALARMTKSYRPSLTVQYIHEELALGSIDDTLNFLTLRGLAALLTAPLNTGTSNNQTLSTAIATEPLEIDVAGNVGSVVRVDHRKWMLDCKLASSVLSAAANTIHASAKSHKVL